MVAGFVALRGPFGGGDGATSSEGGMMGSGACARHMRRLWCIAAGDMAARTESIDALLTESGFTEGLTAWLIWLKASPSSTTVGSTPPAAGSTAQRQGC